MIITVTLNPAIDKTLYIDDFAVDSVNRPRSMRVDAGGKGINVSKVIAALGGHSLATGVIAGNNGRYIKNFLDEQQLANDFLEIAGETRTNLKIVDLVKYTNTDINEPGPEIGVTETDAIVERIIGLVEPDSVMVFSGSVLPGMPADIYYRLIAGCKQRGAITILDADNDLLKNGVMAGPYLLKPNIHELERLVGRKLTAIDDIADCARRLMNDHGIKFMVVSMGRQGALFINGESNAFSPALPVETRSTVSAGDAMVAALAWCLSGKKSFVETVKLAMACGAANVMTDGSNPADNVVVNQLIDRVIIKYR